MEAHTTRLRIISENARPVSGRDYKVFLPQRDVNFAGTANITFKRVIDYKNSKYFQTDNVYNQCVSNYLKSSDIVGHLKMFYPNGSWAKDDDMRKGVGCRVLDKIISDLKEFYDGKVLYVTPTTKCMENFLRKNGFMVCRRFSNQYYLFFHTQN